MRELHDKVEGTLDRINLSENRKNTHMYIHTVTHTCINIFIGKKEKHTDPDMQKLQEIL